MPEIDAALVATGRDPAWLHRKIQAAPFSRQVPIGLMVSRGMKGMASVLQVLNQAVMRVALGKQRG